MRHQFTVWMIAALLGLAAAPAAADGMTEMTRLLKGGDSAQTQGQTATAAKTTLSGDPKAIRLTPDRTKILRLRESAASVIVANPAHASVTLDSPRLLILMPREPGTTSFTVLNAAGKVLLERNIIVSAAQPQYVRVRRVCGNANDCQPSNYYYCPDGCFEVTPVVHENNANIPEVQGNAAQGFAGTMAEDPMIAEEIEGPMPGEDDGILEDDAFDGAPDALEGEAE
ncbi:MAG: pilus assembly protein N-terminal domain-containing protein [Alphaproteobacteria bacterium]|jgi:hypothetical protein